MNELASCSLVEKDTNGDVIWSWTYPCITKKKMELVKRKCDSLVSCPKFVYSRCTDEWFYVYTCEVPERSPLTNVVQLSVVVFASNYSVEIYYKVCTLLSKSYLSHGTSTSVLSVYLKLFSKGPNAVKENGTFPIDLNGMSTTFSRVKELISLFDLEIILIYTAVLLKKRVVVYHHHLHQLMSWMPSFALLASHRTLGEGLHPWLDLTNDDITPIQEGKYNLVGCVDSDVLTWSNCFDIMVNIPAREITISPQAKESFSMTKIHKEIALFLTQLGQSEKSESHVVSSVKDKTEELLAKVRSFNPDSCGKITLEHLKSKSFSQAAENFLLQLAIIENLLVV